MNGEGIKGVTSCNTEIKLIRYYFVKFISRISSLKEKDYYIDLGSQISKPLCQVVELGVGISILGLIWNRGTTISSEALESSMELHFMMQVRILKSQDNETPCKALSLFRGFIDVVTHFMFQSLTQG
ncbi:hypothetical protein RDI58_027138 [Solanum bulbocastanum]|uniref:Uncharacterized protein n=1 Tax=Solanum bulbocastanum TaxID=147425 RepID=A0AAN8SXM1_SOLBU